MDSFAIDQQILLSNLIKILIAFALTLPVAWDREIESRSMGLRTFPLVAIASCAFALIAISFIPLERTDAHSRVLQGLMTGIGFIGGGAILKDSGSVSGTATAASLWGTGVIGASSAYGRFEIALVVSVVTFLLLRGLQPVKGRLQQMVEQEED